MLLADPVTPENTKARKIEIKKCHEQLAKVQQNIEAEIAHLSMAQNTILQEAQHLENEGIHLGFRIRELSTVHQRRHQSRLPAGAAGTFPDTTERPFPGSTGSKCSNRHRNRSGCTGCRNRSRSKNRHAPVRTRCRASKHKPASDATADGSATVPATAVGSAATNPAAVGMFSYASWSHLESSGQCWGSDTQPLSDPDQWE